MSRSSGLGARSNGSARARGSDAKRQDALRCSWKDHLAIFRSEESEMVAVEFYGLCGGVVAARQANSLPTSGAALQTGNRGVSPDPAHPV